MVGNAQQLRHTLGSFELGSVALTIIDAQRVALVALLASNGKHCGGIQATG
jgi:hypothetical protein